MKKSLLFLILVSGSCVLSACGGAGSTPPVLPATHFSVTAPAAVVAGTAFKVTVTALDASNNVVDSYSGTVHFTSSDAQAVLPDNSGLTNGTGIFAATLETAGNQTITAIDTATATIMGVSSAIDVASAEAAGTFTPTGTMGFERAGHTATLLQDGTALITGGENSTGPLATAEIFNPGTGMFTSTKGTMETARVGHTATLLTDGTVLVTGGNDATGALATAEIFHPTTGMFTPLLSMMETVRVGHTATLLNDGTGRVLVAGGGSAPEEFFGAGIDGSTISAELFDPTSGQFTPAGHMSASRIYHTATLLPSGDVLLAGGTDTANTSGASQGDLFQPASATFTATAMAMAGITALHLPAPLLNDGMVLLPGGEVSASPCGEGGSLISSAEATLFNGGDATFSETGSMTASRISHTATLLPGGEVLIAGGAMSHTPCNRGFGTSTFQSIASAELFNPVSGTFTPTGSMLAPRAAHTATLLGNGKVLVVGGVDANGNFLASAELFE
jgi:hypothetical protein